MQLIRVLLIDDDKTYHDLIQKMLNREAAYHIDWISSYDTALNIVSKTQHDVYLVDYRLGDREGLDLLAEFRERNINTPFILLTSYTDRTFERRVFEAGATDYIDKADLKPALLNRVIRNAITRHADAQALRKSEEKYQALLNDASDGILIVSAVQGRVLTANHAAAKMLDVDVSSLMGREVKGFIQPVSAGRVRFIPASVPPDETVIIEQRLLRADGSFLPVEVSAKASSDGNVQCLIRDITHRKAAEAERERYIQHLTILRQIDEEVTQTLNIEFVMALALDATVRLTTASTGFIATVDNNKLKMEQAIGHYSQTKSGEYLPPNPLFEKVIHTQSSQFIPDVREMVGYQPENKDTQAQMVIALNSYDRTLGLLSLETNRAERFTPELFEFCKLIAARIAVAMENAQLYQVAQDQLARLQELYHQVSDLEQLKTDMIHIAAHDLRNPVGVIVGYLELLEWSLDGHLTPKQKEQFDAMNRAAQRMARITTDILSLERIEKLHLSQNEHLLLDTVSREAFDEYTEQATQKNQTLTMILPEKPLTVQADHAQILEAASNLIGNAIKYTPDGGTIRVRVRYENGWGIFEVIDNGYGIPLDQQTSLFQPFFRADSDETRQIEGTGLGLHLVKNIINRHAGEMLFSSVYGEGSTFGFRLPLAQEIKHSAPPTTPAEDAVS